MERIIAGRFSTKDDADAAAALIAQYVDTADICIFHNNPPGQHADKPRAPGRRPGGVMLSVRIADPMNEKRVIGTLRAQGAADIEQAQGEWRDGDWADFNPVAAPRLVLGTGAAEAVNPTAEESFWRETFVREPYYAKGRTYEYYAPGFRAGWQGRVRHDGRSFEEAEPELKAGYNLARVELDPGWQDIRPAARAAWDRVDRYRRAEQ